MRSANMNIRIDPQVKASADEIFKALGITTTDGINIFLNRVIAEGGIPFDVKVKKPSASLLAAMQEAERLEKEPQKRYSSVADLFEELDRDEVSD